MLATLIPRGGTWSSSCARRLGTKDNPVAGLDPPRRPASSKGPAPPTGFARRVRSCVPGHIPHAAMSETSSNGPERFRPTGIERYVLPHLLVLSVADPSVISPTLSPPGRPFQCPTALTRPSEFIAPADRTVTDDATCKTARARTFDVSENFYATTLRLLQIVLSR